jgi:hypothetical protein
VRAEKLPTPSWPSVFSPQQEARALDATAHA